MLQKKIFDSGIRPTDPEETILAGIKRLCVRAHNNMVNIMALQEIYQENHETISQFAARLNGFASTCDFVVICSCKVKVSFSENSTKTLPDKILFKMLFRISVII